jgi:hypothetical protein
VVITTLLLAATFLLFAQLESKSDQAVSCSQTHAHEVAKLQVALDNTAAELALVKRQLASAEEERTSAAKRSSALLVQWEERDRGQSQEITTLRWAAIAAASLV